MGMPRITAEEIGATFEESDIQELDDVLMNFYLSMSKAIDFILEKTMTVGADFLEGKISEDEIHGRVGLFPFRDFAHGHMQITQYDAEDIANEALAPIFGHYDIEYNFMFQLDGLGQLANFPNWVNKKTVSYLEEILEVTDDTVPRWRAQLEYYLKWAGKFIHNARSAHKKYGKGF